MIKRFVFFGGIIILLLLFSQFLVPAAISDVAAGAIKTLARAEKVEVEVKKFPAVLMLGGQFDEINIKAAGVQTERIVFDAIDLYVKQANLDMMALVRTRTLTMQAAGDIAIKGILSEAQLASTINKTVKGAKNAEVKISPDKVKVKSTISLGGIINAAIALEGKFIVVNDKIVFTTEHFNIDNGIIGKLGGSIFTDLVLVDLKQLPFDVVVKDIVLEEGRAVVYANNHH